MRLEKTMQYLIYVTFLLLVAAPQWSAAQDANDTSNKIMDLGNGLVLEIIPAEYVTVSDNTRCLKLSNSIEWVTIPATYETVTETVIVQAGYTDVDVSPPVYNFDGSIQLFAKAQIKEIPAVTKQVTLRKVKTPARMVQRTQPVICTPQTRRKLLKSKSYKIKDKSGITLNHFENAESFAEYINFK